MGEDPVSSRNSPGVIDPKFEIHLELILANLPTLITVNLLDPPSLPVRTFWVIPAGLIPKDEGGWQLVVAHLAHYRLWSYIAFILV